MAENFTTQLARQSLHVQHYVNEAMEKFQYLFSFNKIRLSKNDRATLSISYKKLVLEMTIANSYNSVEIFKTHFKGQSNKSKTIANGMYFPNNFMENALNQATETFTQINNYSFNLCCFLMAVVNVYDQIEEEVKGHIVSRDEAKNRNKFLSQLSKELGQNEKVGSKILFSLSYNNVTVDTTRLNQEQLDKLSKFLKELF